jgi:HAD superfamily hydrolase (TIGR01450 family)
LVHDYDTALLDLDGVLYIGPDAVEGAPEAVQQARNAGMRVAFVTNNASRTPDAVAKHLGELGVSATADDVVTSAQAAATMLAERLPAGSRVLVVGGEGLVVALRERGLEPVSSADDDPAAVVQGYAPDVGWAQLAEGAYAVGRGLPWIASNLDRTLPTARGTAPGNGALVGVITVATGVRPVAAGKPELPLHQEAVRRTGAGHPLVVGDRLDTDIEGANRAGTDSLLVLTGVDGPADLLAAEPGLRPTYVAADLRTGLFDPHPEVTGNGSDRSCGGWSVSRSGGRWQVDGDGDKVAGLRALCVAAWTAGSGPDPDAALPALGW